MPSARSMGRKFTPFCLSMTLPELSWLAGVFGLTRLALPVPLPPLSDAQIRQAQDSLSKRGLIRRASGTGWQVDRLAAFLVHWLGETEQCAFVEIHRREGEARNAGMYLWKGLSLLVWCDQGELEFVFIAEENALWDELARRLDIPPARAGKGIFRLPEPVPLIRLAWRDPEAAHRALLNADLPKAAATSTLAWIDSLSTAVLFTPFPFQSNLKPLLLCSDGKAAWMNSSDGMQKKDKSDEFHPCSLTEAATQVHKFL
jgi:hypothetical protein